VPQYSYNTAGAVAYSHISNAGTFAVKTAAGDFFSINVNSATAGATATLFDQAGTATGTVDIAVLTLGTADVVPLRVAYGPEGQGIKFANGLAVLTTGTVDLTIAYR